MGTLYVTNLTGLQISTQYFSINGTNLCQQPTSVSSGSTLNWSYSDKTAAEYDDMILKISCNNTIYSIDLNRGHFFGDNNGAYPGADYDINFVLMGFNGNEISLMMVYRNSAGGIFTYCNDVKDMQS
ncbi:hypothetical protein [Yokenella regensburgei]|uniref:hypothetical protein n=1 Tax=Yokenella regensburgei TaxID=158877 RepID=UPI001375672F|nr:hypothetical protein [Yokenella regensburgei]KAF1367352.1 hypothetical protein FHR25_004032 [Yokenella regensburgei]